MPSYNLPQLFPDSSYLSNLVHDLRTLGLHYTLKTPLLFVCGKTSSGKSSVLEAITHIPFPISSSTCTPFAVEVAFRRGQTPTINVSIEPGLYHVDEQQSQRLRQFKPTLSSLDDLPLLIRQATAWLGIDASALYLTDDVLKIEIIDPSNLDMTILDLPGLCDSNGENTDGIAIAHGLGERYRNNPRYLIFPLLVFTCGKGTLKDVIGLVDTLDPTRKRTTSVIAKADLLPGSDDPSKFFPASMPETLMPHALVNRSPEMATATHDERDELEKCFFEIVKWRPISRRLVGIDSLRYRLKTIIQESFKDEILAVAADIKTKISACQARLSKLGPPRSTLKDQRGYLLNVSGNFERITSQALRGVYVDPFFAGGTLSQSNPRKLRTTIRFLGECFSLAMGWKGHRRIVMTGPPATARTLQHMAQFKEIPNSTVVTFADLEAEVNSQLEQYPRGLPGGTAISLIGKFFRDQSSSWDEIAQKYLVNVWEFVRRFVQVLLTYLTDEHTCKKLVEAVLDPALIKMMGEMARKTKELGLYRQRGYPAAYMSEGIGVIQPPGQQGFGSAASQILQQAEVLYQVSTRATYLDLAKANRKR